MMRGKRVELVVKQQKNKQAKSKPKATQRVAIDLQSSNVQRMQRKTRPQQQSEIGMARPMRQQDGQIYFRLEAGPVPGSVRIRGRDFLTSVIHDTSKLQGYNLFNGLINPSTGVFAGTRLSKFALLFDKYLFRNLRFHVTSAAPSTSGGSYLGAYDRDMADPTPADHADSVKQYMGMMGSQTVNSFQDLIIQAPLSDLQDFYYTNDTGYEGRITSQGQFYLASVVAPSSSVVYNIWCDYVVDLFDPQNDPAQLTEVKFEKTGAAANSSNASHAGFNFANTVQTLGNSISSGVDGQGNTYLNFLNPGTYSFEQLYSSVSGVVQAITPDVVSNLTGNTITSTAWAALFTLGTVVGGSPGILTGKLTIPPGGAKVYGNWNAVTQIASLAIRALPVPQGYF